MKSYRDEFTSGHQYSLSEASRLFRVINTDLEVVSAAYQELRAMQRELDAFLDHYYSRITPLCEQIELLRCHASKREVLPFATHDASAVRKDADCPIDKYVKFLYRKLLKASHPDNGNRAGSAALDIVSVIAAYEEKDAGKLWRLMIELECMEISHEDLVGYLVRQRNEIFDFAHMLADRKVELAESPEWILMERVVEAGVRGEDMVSHIAERLRTKINALQKSSKEELPHTILMRAA